MLPVSSGRSLIFFFLYISAYVATLIFVSGLIARANSIPLHEIPKQLKFNSTMFHGRINRSRWWAYMALSLAAWLIAYLLVAIARLTPLPMPKVKPAIITFVLYALFLPPLIWQAAFVIRRFHDRNKRGWWALLWFAPWPALAIDLGMTKSGVSSLIDLILVLIVVLSVLLWLRSFIELGFLRGTQGKNGYGPMDFSFGS